MPRKKKSHPAKPPGRLQQYLTENFSSPDADLLNGHVLFMYVENDRSNARTVEAIKERVAEPVVIRPSRLHNLVGKTIQKYKQLARESDMRNLDAICRERFVLARQTQQEEELEETENVSAVPGIPSTSPHHYSSPRKNPAGMSSNEVNGVGVIPVVLVHGGAWAIPDDLVEDSKAGVQNAARAGYRTLEEAGGTALDAVVAAVCVLEDDPAFDAGTGSVLNEEGVVEMDSVVMEGRELKAGSIACVKNIKNPVKLARLVLEKTDHTMLVGEGANKFAKAMGMDEVPMSTLINAKAMEDFQNFKKFRKVVDHCFHSRPSGHDTVGAVAVDRHGNVACATSTGGISAKMVGRVGDSPIIGSGAYCDNASGAASTTGHGESIVKVTLARQVLYNMQNGDNAQQAAERAISYMSSRVNGSGGTIAVSKTGDIGISFSTERMAWAWAKSGSMHFGINPQEDFTVTS